MRKHCLKIVEFKIDLDNQLKKTVGNKDYFPSINPVDYGKAVFPFWDDKISNKSNALSVNCYEVVGGNFQNYTNEDQSITACNKLNSSAAGGFGAPSYHKVGNFPIYFAWEGKNRVSLFRKHALNITSDVKYTVYPIAKSLKIHKCYFRKIYFVSCSDKSIYGSNKTIQIAFPELTVPLLRAYGVEYGSKLFKLFAFSSRKKTLKNLSIGLMRG